MVVVFCLLCNSVLSSPLYTNTEIVRPNVISKSSLISPTIVNPLSEQQKNTVNHPSANVQKVTSPVILPLNTVQQDNQTEDKMEVSSVNAEAFSGDYVPNQIIVKFKGKIENVVSTQGNSYDLVAQDVIANVGGSVVDSMADLDAPEYYLVEETNQDIFKLIELYKLNPYVEYAEPNGIYSIGDVTEGQIVTAEDNKQSSSGDASIETTYPSDPFYNRYQWYLSKIEAPNAWDISKGSEGRALIAVVDTGVDLDHRDLDKNLWRNRNDPINGVDDDRDGRVDDYRGWDFVNNDNSPWDDDNHGTHCAGLIGARGNDGFGITGVCWWTKILPIKVLDSNGRGSWWNIAQGIRYAAGKGANIISLSLGGTGYSQSVKDACVTAKNSLLVCAAGNSALNNDNTPHYPSSLSLRNILAVGATTKNNYLCSFSNYGKASVDIVAPGDTLMSTIPSPAGGPYYYETMSGTSMATPLVSGLAGLIRAKKPYLSNYQIRDIIMKKGQYYSWLSSKIYTGERIHAYWAVRDA